MTHYRHLPQLINLRTRWLQLCEAHVRRQAFVVEEAVNASRLAATRWAECASTLASRDAAGRQEFSNIPVTKSTIELRRDALDVLVAECQRFAVATAECERRQREEESRLAQVQSIYLARRKALEALRFVYLAKKQMLTRRADAIEEDREQEQFVTMSAGFSGSGS